MDVPGGVGAGLLVPASHPRHLLACPLQGSKDWGLTDLAVYQGRLWLGLGCVGDTADLASPPGPHSLNVEEQ